MSLIPFIPALDAREILEVEYEGEAARAEYEADLASSFFFGGGSASDATWYARQDSERRQRDFESTPEGVLHMRKVEAAKFMESATCGLDVHVPEFVLGFKPTVLAPAEDDIPF